MRTIRQNTFETNSSSTHTLTITILTDEEYKKWLNDELGIGENSGEPIDISENSKELAKVKKLNNGFLYKETFYENMYEVLEAIGLGDCITQRKVEYGDGYSSYDLIEKAYEHEDETLHALSIYKSD